MKDNKSAIVFCGISKRFLYQTNDENVLAHGLAKSVNESCNRYEYLNYDPGKGFVCCGTKDGNFSPDTKLGKLNGRAFLEGSATFDETSFSLHGIKSISPISFRSFYSNVECLDTLKSIPENRDIIYLKTYLTAEESAFVKENGNGSYVFDVFGSGTEEVFKDENGFYYPKEFIAFVFDPKTVKNIGNGLGGDMVAEGFSRLS